MSKYYGGGIICLRDENGWGREIALWERVRVNSTGEEGIIHEMLVGSSVHEYYVEFADGNRWNQFKPDEITPVENP